MTKEINRVQQKITFSKHIKYLAILDCLRDDPQMIYMFFKIPRVNEDIINKDNNKIVQVLLEYSVHHVNESCRGIGKS